MIHEILFGVLSQQRLLGMSSGGASISEGIPAFARGEGAAGTPTPSGEGRAVLDCGQLLRERVSPHGFRPAGPGCRGTAGAGLLARKAGGHDMGRRKASLNAIQDEVADGEFRSSLPVIQVRCRGSCAYVQQPGDVSLDGEHIGVVVRKDRCPQCDGRMMELFLHYAGRQHSGQAHRRMLS